MTLSVPEWLVFLSTWTCGAVTGALAMVAAAVWQANKKRR
jgi:hypothetical protein